MKYIKGFENVSSDISVGNYAIVKIDYYSTTNKRYLHENYDNYVDFVNNNIGLVISKIFSNRENVYKYGLKYNNIPKDISILFSDDIKFFRSDDISHYAETFDDVQTKIVSQEKYNL